MLKILSITQRAVKFTKFLSLIADTVKYFHDEGLKRGVFGDDVKSAVENV